MNINFKNFEHKLCCAYLTELNRLSPRHGINLSAAMRHWLDNNIGEDNFIFGIEGAQDSEWMLYTASREDLLAFRLRWAV